ncbi:hypothetical protein BV25DRAFT_1873322 [Artomyces pyxidatus]|uniref:Uncharacterized protein n=1 Tax=Artomyces pyxidatus TaxID=48021 RepID=A0ACB8SD90_9AGAM|nr:hypothetical protein BV25DRAFT_1873322 [Artomyces pyxidatus]
MCHGQPRVVSKATYYRHMRIKYLAMAEAAAAEMGDLQEEDLDQEEEEVPEEEQEEPQRKRQRLVCTAFSNVWYNSDRFVNSRALWRITPDPLTLVLIQILVMQRCWRSRAQTSTTMKKFQGWARDVPVCRQMKEEAHAEGVQLEEVDLDVRQTSRIQEFQDALDFIQCIKDAKLDNDKLPPEVIERLRNPLQFTPEIESKGLRLSLDTFLATSNASQQSYTDVCAGIKRAHPEDELLSYDQMKSTMAELSGIVPIVEDMCIGSCAAYTGPFADRDTCPVCSEPRYDQIKLRDSGGKDKVPRQVYHTIPLGPQLQALWRSPESARALRYRSKITEEVIEELRQGHQIEIYEDIVHGSDYLKAVQRGDIGPNDMVVMLSLDGCQLYRSKKSDCWIYIWIVCDFSPDLRYIRKRLLPGGFIRGPNNLKHADSFFLPGVRHVSALQKEGFHVWDADQDVVFVSKPFVIFVTADRPAMAHMDGQVPHNGARGCRLGCPLKGRHKEGQSCYYPALLKPDNYDVAGCTHPDIAVRQFLESPPDPNEYLRNLKYVQNSRTITEYHFRRKITGISKPSILSGLPSTSILPLPTCFPVDIMHLLSLNIPELLLKLWRGTMECDPSDDKATWEWAVLRGDVWIEHGRAVAECTPYLPGSFDRPPRNPVEKISSGYKAWEYLLYIYGFGPALLHGILPDKYWRSYCKLVSGARVIQQHRIFRNQLVPAHRHLCDFVEEFEALYYQRHPGRIHFCRQSIHTLPHLAPEVVRTGPSGNYSQWTMERVIGDLGSEIRQPSNPYANLSERGVLRSHVNSMKAMIPDLEPEKSKIPRGGRDLGEGYVLLRAREKYPHLLEGVEAEAVLSRLVPDAEPDENIAVAKWARLRLPTGQVARSAWKEKLKPLEKTRMARNVKVRYQGTIRFAEVQYYFRGTEDDNSAFAVVRMYSEPDAEMLEASYNTVWSCTYLGPEATVVVPVSDILSVIAMVPFPNQHHLAYEEKTFFLVEKPGLEVASRAGLEEEMAEV